MNFEYNEQGNPLEHDSIGIENVVSFDELYEKLRAFGNIEGSQKFYTPEMLIKKIEQVRHGHSNLLFITRSYGLRDVVARLLLEDAVYKKYCGDKK